jgi:hypothetical protein
VIPLLRGDESKHRCHAVCVVAPNGNLDTSMSATVHDIESLWEQAAWPDLEQPVGDAAPVVLWQYKINNAVRAEKSRFVRAGKGPTIEWVGVPNGAYELEVMIVQPGHRGEATFSVRDKSSSDSAPPGEPGSTVLTTAKRVELPDIGIWLVFHEGEYVAGTTYSTTIATEVLDGHDAWALTAEHKALAVDLMATSPHGFQGRPVVDFFLERSGADD